MLSDEFNGNFAQNLLKATAYAGGDGAKSYSVTCALPKDHPFWKRLRTEMKAAAVEKWGKVPKGLRQPPIKDGDEAEEKYGWAGCWNVRFKRSEDDGKPQFVDSDGDPIEGPELSGETVYSGALIRVSYHIGAWDNKYGKGLTVYLDNVQIIDNDPETSPRLGRAHSNAADDFANNLDGGGGYASEENDFGI